MYIIMISGKMIFLRFKEAAFQLESIAAGNPSRNPSSTSKKGFCVLSLSISFIQLVFIRQLSLSYLRKYSLLVAVLFYMF